MNFTFAFPADLIKSGDETAERIPVRVIPNHPTVDRQNEKIVLKAFSQPTIDDYLQNSRVIDYDHKSILGKDDLEKSNAIIGEAESLVVDLQKGIPILDGFLFRSHDIVEKSILPALKAGSRVYGASIGGRVLKKSLEMDPTTRRPFTTISEISLNHVAICPVAKAVNTRTLIQLRKSCAGDGSCGNGECSGHCGNGYQINFKSFDVFMKSFVDSEELSKAIAAGSGTDSAALSGGQALQGQSLEGDGKKRKKKKEEKLKSVMPFIVDAAVNGLCKGGFDAWVAYLERRGLDHEEAQIAATTIASRAAQIAKVIRGR